MGGAVACSGKPPAPPDIEGGSIGYFDSVSDEAGDAVDAPDADAGPDSGPGGNLCSSASDCRTYSNPCVGCACMPIGASAVIPACNPPSLFYGPKACVGDPCAGRTVICIGTCSLQ